MEKKFLKQNTVRNQMIQNLEMKVSWVQDSEKILVGWIKQNQNYKVKGWKSIRAVNIFLVRILEDEGNKNIDIKLSKKYDRKNL